MNPNEALSKHIGDILRYALNVELFLEDFLINYYFACPSDKIELFNDSILFEMKFDWKIKCFENICKHEKINAKQLIKDIRDIQKTRNKVAHYLSEYNEEKNNVILKKKTTSKEKDSLFLDDKINAEIGERMMSIRKRIYDIQNDLLRKGRITVAAVMRIIKK